MFSLIQKISIFVESIDIVHFFKQYIDTLLLKFKVNLSLNNVSINLEYASIIS